jgi:hypothetical protein
MEEHPMISPIWLFGYPVGPILIIIAIILLFA